MHQSKSKHTPGPWKVFNAWQNGDAINFSRIGNENETIITVQSSDDITAFKKADLYLIAAVPELLEALEEIAEGGDDGNCTCEMSEGYHAIYCPIGIATIARAAIAKAKGES